MKEVLASVIIPHYNLPDFLDEAIESVLNQTFDNFELIVVDLGSDDPKALQILNKYSKYLNFRVVTKKLKWNLPEARNIGIREAKGKYICCLDADDIYYPDFLKKTVDILEKDIEEKLGFVTTFVELFDNEKGIWQFERPNIARMLTENAAHVASLFRKEVWEKVNGYDTTLVGYQDWNFWISIVERGYLWEVLEEPLFKYRRREQSMLTSSKRKDLGLYESIIDKHTKIFKANYKNLLIYIRDRHNKLTDENKHLTNVVNNYEKDLRKASREVSILKFQNQSLEGMRVQFEAIQRSILWQIRNLIKDRSLPLKQRIKLALRILFRILPFGENLKKQLIKLRPKKVIHIINQLHEGPLVSVVIPLYNYGRYIDEAVQSVLDQGLGNKVEIIIVEGFSSDGTREMVKERKWLHTKIIFQDHRASIGENRLLGISTAKGKYICCLDADDKLGKGYLKHAIEVLEVGHYDVAYPDTKQFEEDDKEIIAPDVFVLDNLFHWNYISTIAVFRKSFWEENKVGYSFDRETFEDWDFWMRMASKGARFVHIPGFYHVYRVHTSESESMTDIRLAKQKEREEMTKNNFKEFLGSEEYRHALNRLSTIFKIKNPYINIKWKRK